jgi:glyoxylase-like metal-dependent hydrolase (beta-lactamase superfamily II)
MSRIRFAVASIAVSFAASSLLAQSPALEAAAQAMGGKDRLLAIRTLVLEGTGEQLSFGQNHTPYAETMFEVTSWTRSFDFPNRRWFMDMTRVPKFTTGNMNPQRQRQGLDGAPDGIAYNIGGGPPPAPGMQAPATMSRVGGQAATERIYEFLYHPLGFLKTANIQDVTVTEEAVPGNMRRVTMSPLGSPVSMVIDGRTNLPARIERKVYQPMLGDVTYITHLSDYRDVGGIKMPMRIVQGYENIITTARLNLTASRVDADVGNIGVTDSIRTVAQQAAAQPAPGGPPPLNVAVDTLAPGVWRIAGGTHHTIAIELSNQVVLVEAPQNDARTLAAIAKARELRPAKSLDLLINTHHHFDHAGGIRAAISQGLTIVTHEGNKEFYEKVVYPRSHTITPDALAQNPKPLRIRAVGQTHVINDPMRTIEVHHVAGNAHNGNMLVVYLPAEKILIQADLYNPPAANAQNPTFPFAANLLEMIQRKRLQVDRVVGIHGAPATFAEFQAAATRTP